MGLDEGAPFYWTLYTAARILSGASPGEPLVELVARISPTPLLLIAMPPYCSFDEDLAGCDVCRSVGVTARAVAELETLFYKVRTHIKNGFHFTGYFTICHFHF